MNILTKFVGFLRRKLVGSAIHELPLRIETLQHQLEEHNKLFRRLSDENETVWLYLNREERMDANDPIFDRRRREFHLDRYRFASKYTSGQTIVDIACGTGYGSSILVNNGDASSVLGIDIDDKAIDYAKRHYGAANCRFVASNANQTEVASQSIDLVVSFETIEHVDDDRALLQEFNRILKPGGTLICSTPNQWPTDDATHHVREYGLREFDNVLTDFFSIDAMFNQNSGAGKYNRDQKAGIRPTSEDNHWLAECFIAICTRKELVDSG